MGKVGGFYCSTKFWVPRRPDFLKESHRLAVNKRELQPNLSGAFPRLLVTVDTGMSHRAAPGI